MRMEVVELCSASQQKCMQLNEHWYRRSGSSDGRSRVRMSRAAKSITKAEEVTNRMHLETSKQRYSPRITCWMSERARRFYALSDIFAPDIQKHDAVSTPFQNCIQAPAHRC
jgi:hypothetical protein